MKDYLLCPKRDKGNAMKAQIKLDPTQPYLRDHDVGLPLFGTSMSVEAMAESMAVVGGWEANMFYDITSGTDCLITKEETLAGEVWYEQKRGFCNLEHNGRNIFCCRMSLEKLKEMQTGKNVFHGVGVEKVNGCFQYGTAVDEVRRCLKQSVGADQIYSCFFHGPAFRVVRRARFDGKSTYAEMNPALIPLCQDRTYSTVLPVQVLELCLQTSGLLDAAAKHYMSVPLKINRITVCRKEISGGVWTRAVAAQQGTDILAWDEQGSVILWIEGYQTRPMPYESDGFEALWQGLEEHI